MWIHFSSSGESHSQSIDNNNENPKQLFHSHSHSHSLSLIQFLSSAVPFFCTSSSQIIWIMCITKFCLKAVTSVNFHLLQADGNDCVCTCLSARLLTRWRTPKLIPFCFQCVESIELNSSPPASTYKCYDKCIKCISLKLTRFFFFSFNADKLCLYVLLCKMRIKSTRKPLSLISINDKRTLAHKP